MDVSDNPPASAGTLVVQSIAGAIKVWLDDKLVSGN